MSKLIFGDPASKVDALAESADRRKFLAAKLSLAERIKAGYPCASRCREHGRYPWEHDWHESCPARLLWVPALKRHGAEVLRGAMLELIAEWK